MVSIRFAASLLALSAATNAIQFNQPRATPINKRFDANGWTPIPTSKPKPLMELFRRQEDPAFCGYLEGDPDYAVTCDAGSSCMYDTVYSWFGCCTGTSITDCDVYTSCVPSSSVDACLSASSCYNDDLAMFCTDSDEQYCATLITSASDGVYDHYVCAETETSLEVVSTTSDLGDDSSGFLATATSEDFFTSRPSLTRFIPSSRSTDDDSSSSTSKGNVTPLSSPGSRTPTSAAASSQTAASASASTAAAARTAEAMLGAAGGLAGVLAFVL